MQSARARLLAPHGRRIYYHSTKGDVPFPTSLHTHPTLLHRSWQHQASINFFHTVSASRGLGGAAVKNRYRAKGSQAIRKSSGKSTSTTGQQQSTSSQEQTASNGGFFAAFIAWYEGYLTKFPLATKALTGGAIAAGGDFFCQTFLESDQFVSTADYDPARSFRFGILGTCFVAPTNHIWYRFLAKRVAPGKTWTSATTRTVLDQFGWTRKSFFSKILSQLSTFLPCGRNLTTFIACETAIYTFIWLGALWKMEGSSNDDVVDALKREYVGVMKANWLLWIPAQMVRYHCRPAYRFFYF